MSRDKKEFALSQIAPYYYNRSLCAINIDNTCSYKTKEGKMCVAGKNFSEEGYKLVKSKGELTSCIYSLIQDLSQASLFKPEVVGILITQEWSNLQSIHDAIAMNFDETTLEKHIKRLDLFTLDELKEYCEK